MITSFVTPDAIKELDFVQSKLEGLAKLSERLTDPVIKLQCLEIAKCNTTYLKDGFPSDILPLAKIFYEWVTTTK